MTTAGERVSKRLAHCLCVMLSFSLALFCVPAHMAFAANADDGADPACARTINYVSLGDSFTTGFGLDGCYSSDIYADPYTSRQTPFALGYKNCPDGSYPDLIVEELESRGYEVTHSQMAQSGMRADDLRYLLDEDYPADGYNQAYFTGDGATTGRWTLYGLEDMRAEYREAIQSADLITYDLGKNNFGGYLSAYLMIGSYDANMQIVLGEDGAERYNAIRQSVRDIVDAYYSEYVSEEDLASIEKLIDGLSYSLWGFEVNFDAAIDEIRELNPDVEIVFVNVGNVAAGIKIEVGGVTIPLGTIYGCLSDVASSYVMKQSKHRYDLIFADGTLDSGGTYALSEEVLEYNGDPTTLDANFRNCCDYCCSELGYLRATAEKKLEAAYGDAFDEGAFDEAMLSGYDAVATIMQYILEIDPMPFTGLLKDGDLTTNVYAALGSIATASYGAIVAAYGEATGSDDADGITADDYIDEAISSISSSDERLGAIGLYLKSGFASAWVSHPNRAGHAAIADAIIEAWDEGTTAREAYITTTAKLVVRYAQAWKTFRDSFREQLREYVRDYYADRGDRVAEIIDGLPEDCTAQEAIEAIAKGLGLRNASDLEELYSLMEEAMEQCRATVHVHSMHYHSAKLATCTSEGSTAYWECEECGEMFLDRSGRIEIDAPYTVSALGHHWRTVPALKLFRFTIVPSYQVCTICGERHFG